MRRREDLHPGPVVAEFDRVRKQIVESLLELAPVKRDFIELGGDV
jgi:hypothetical protein